MAIVTCGPFMAQIARADTWKFLQTNLQYYIYLLNNYLKWLEQVSDHIPVSTCGSALLCHLCHKWHTFNNLQMLMKLESRIMHLCTQISNMQSDFTH